MTERQLVPPDHPLAPLATLVEEAQNAMTSGMYRASVEQIGTWVLNNLALIFKDDGRDPRGRPGFGHIGRR